MKHEPEIQSSSAGTGWTYGPYKARCSCGYVGFWRRFQWSAYKDANRHAKDAQNAAQRINLEDA
jgi:hypothetical protein